MNDFNRAAILLKEYDHKKWDNLPKTTKIELVNDYLEFRNRLIVAAIMGNANELFRNEVDEAEKKYIKVDKINSRNKKKTTKRIPETENSLKLSLDKVKFIISLYIKESSISLDLISSPMPMVAITGLGFFEHIERAGKICNPFHFTESLGRDSISKFAVDFELMNLSRVPSTVSNS